MVRKFDKKNNCECEGKYFDSNKWKHEKTKRRHEWSKKSTDAITQDNHVICKHCHSVIHNSTHQWKGS